MEDDAWQRLVQSESRPGAFHIVKFSGGVFSCDCMAWRVQRLPITRRTCKHLVRVLGADVESKRAPESFAALFEGKPLKITPKSKPIEYLSYTPLRAPTRSTLDGWYYSIKLNGAFGRWVGRDAVLKTKSGRILENVPDRIKDRLPPDVELDGEIYAPSFQNVRKALAGHWDSSVDFVVFDLYDKTLPFVKRLERLRLLHKKYGFKMVITRELSDAEEELPQIMDTVRRQNDEGIVFRSPSGMYGPSRADTSSLKGRSKDVLKWKPETLATGRLMRIEPRKKGQVLVIEFEGRTLKLYEPHPQEQTVGTKIDFVFYGRDEAGHPELPRLS